MTTSFLRPALAGFLLAIALAAPVAAQEAEAPARTGLGFGVKAGVGIEPTQFVLGAQYSLGKSLGIVRVVPNTHIGFGDGGTIWDLNVDFLLRLIVADNGFGFYGGGAPTVAFVSDHDTDFGFSLVVGTQLPLMKAHATNIEARFGTGSLPDFRLLLTLVF
jgi:hypothetical protein